MSSSTRFLTILVLVGLQTTIVLGAKPLHYICNAASSSETYPPHGTYATNLEAVFSDLYRKAAFKNTGSSFISSTAGVGYDSAYGQVLCRGDVSASYCQFCLSEAITAARYLCGFNRSVVVWYAFCSLKFSGHASFGQLDLHNNFTKANRVALTDSDSFMNRTTMFLEQLSEGASTSVRRYAAGKKRLCGYLSLYGSAQCNGDISNQDCASCLKTAIAVLPKGNKQGARSLFWSCNVRYEIYSFMGKDAHM